MLLLCVVPSGCRNKMSFVIWFLRVRCQRCMPPPSNPSLLLLLLLLMLPITSATATTTTNRIVCTFCVCATRSQNAKQKTRKQNPLSLPLSLPLPCHVTLHAVAVAVTGFCSRHICRSHLTILLICFVQHTSPEIKTQPCFISHMNVSI